MIYDQNKLIEVVCLAAVQNNGSFLAKPRQRNCTGKSVHPSLLVCVANNLNPCEDLTPKSIH